ncbi:LOW QUALITY PROTEIN: uncharacterized protein KIAA1522 homolog [Hypomesus transpacificus]|uniref:LOW QUALITY PROTEIN: uncharacterized protein KIAA1522 homolog n=1 Tax=Hypomesus transpacificus TaxID=137520 RepID=UPI001F0738BD|nr:LOW QUALITY PROTEIN: uncharacterized protein KIAA1522 homolog [Hypomesus transpacificus]
MSARGSVGELIPQDMAEVFAQERSTRGGRRKKRRGSLGRAFSWLKGKKKKELGCNSLDTHPGGTNAARPPPTLPLGHAAVRKQEVEVRLVPPPFQENVFLEGSRPQYLEDLHSEAREGLKLLQQEESDNGVDFKDDQSISVSSTVTVQQSEYCSYSERSAVESDSTIPDSESTVSTRSSRSGLTRQASTFGPLSSGNKPGKAKARRRHRRTTVMGIPQHIQKELGLDRAAWAAQVLEEDARLHNGDGPHPAGPQEGARDEALQTISENQARGGPRDDLALLQPTGPQISALQRPKSVAIPWLTTASSLAQHPPSPVMSISPQATYLSKIIPNAVLPPSIDVVEISRGRSRNSVRTVSKSSLLLASPASSRASSRASSQASTLSSASRYNQPTFSDSSGWSRSESSETLVSDSSTISSSTARQGQYHGEVASPETSPDQVSVRSSISKAPRITTSTNGKARTRGEESKQEGNFIRSLSVMKSKRAPPPPSRSYSLHKDKMKRRSRDLAEVRVVVVGESPPHLSPGQGGEARSGSSPRSGRNTDSPGYTADTSSLEESSVSASPVKPQNKILTDDVAEAEPASTDSSFHTQPSKENGLKTTVSPSSGYSSQGGTPTLPARHTHSVSPKHKKGFLAKLQNIFPGASPTPYHAQPATTDKPVQADPAPPEGCITPTPLVLALRGLFNIPPPPRVPAPPAPPPEVWVHNKRSFELLLGPPAPTDTYSVLRKNPKDRRAQKQSGSKEASLKSLSAERREVEQPPAQQTVAVLKRVLDAVESNVLEGHEKEQSFLMLSSSGTVMFESGKVQGSLKVQATENSSSVVHEEENERLNQMESTEKKGNAKVEWEDEQENVKRSFLINGKSVRLVEEGLTTSQQAETKTALQTPSQAQGVKIASPPESDTLCVCAQAVARVSPSPPPAHLPPLPPTKQTTPASHLNHAPPEPLVSPTGESSWPLPPPLLDAFIEPPLCGHDESDFLPPPPPFSPSQVGLDVTEQIPPTEESQGEKHLITPPPISLQACDSGKEPVQKLDPPSPSVSAVNGPAPESSAVTTRVQSQSIPPPPPYAAPLAPPPKETLASAESKLSPPQSIPPPAQSIPPPPESIPPPPQSISPPPQSIPPRSKKIPPPPQSITPPSQSIPPPPQVVLTSPQPQKPAKISAQDATSSAERVTVPSPPKMIPPPPESTLTPPQSIPSPPPLKDSQPPTQEDTSPPQPETPQPPSQKTTPLPPPAPATPLIPPAPPIPVNVSANIPNQPSVVSTERWGQELKSQSESPPPVSSPEGAIPVVTPSLLQMVRLRSVKNPPSQTQDQTQTQTQDQTQTQTQDQTQDQTKTQEQDQTQDQTSAFGTATQSSNSVSNPAFNSQEAPQKPMRRSLIMISPPPVDASPPAVLTSPSTVQSYSNTPVLNLSPTSTTITSPTKKSPPATTTTPSMRLQEAIRLRTAARTVKDSCPSRLSMHSPASPPGAYLHKSPSASASFVFSKSAKKVVMDPASSQVATTNFNNKLVAQLPSVSGPNKATEVQKRGLKVPPPVAKKPQAEASEAKAGEAKAGEAKAGEAEAGEAEAGEAEAGEAEAGEAECGVDTEHVQAAGQQAQSDNIKGSAEAPSGTAA